MNGGDISAKTTNEEVVMSDDEKMFLYARGCAFKSLDTIPHASDNGAAKSDRRIQKHDDGRNGFDSLRIKFT